MSLVWSVVHAAELHAVALLVVLGPAARPPPASPPPPTPCIEVLVDEAPAPAVEKGEAMRRAPVLAPVPGRPGRHARAYRGAPPASAASAVAYPDVGKALPVGTGAPVYPGGLTSSAGTSGKAVAELGSGGTLPGDLSAPAHLDGRRPWSCNVEGAPDETMVRVQALVRPDGSAVRVELLDQGDVPELVLSSAAPCALAERYVPGRDRDGRPALRWTRPFRIVVVGVEGGPR